MRLTVLGHYGSFSGAGGACSGYLVEHNGYRLLLDCGNGVLSRLQQYCSIDDLSAILLSHLHFDHIGDIFPLRYAIETRLALGETLPLLPLYYPATPAEAAAMLAEDSLFTSILIKDGMRSPIGPFQVEFLRMDHSIESYAISICVEGEKLVYSGDTLMNPRLMEIAAGADLLLCEATVAGDISCKQDALPHMTANQAAQTAAIAGVHRLLLTHFWYRQDREMLLAEARRTFAASELAEEMHTYEICQLS